MLNFSKLRRFPAECDEEAQFRAGYASLYTALLAQHQVLGQVEIAFPLKVIERFDIERMLLKKKGEAPSSGYTSIRNLALGGAVRGTNGEEILRFRLAALGLAAANG